MASGNLLDDAKHLTDGPRADAYGNVLEAAERFAKIASGMTGLDVKPEHFPLFGQAIKFSRIAAAPKSWSNESWTDVAGWARVAELLHEQDVEAEKTRTYEVAPGLHLSRESIAALHHHYTKNGIPETQTGATELAAALDAWLKDHPDH